MKKKQSSRNFMLSYWFWWWLCWKRWNSSLKICMVGLCTCWLNSNMKYNIGKNKWKCTNNNFGVKKSRVIRSWLFFFKNLMLPGPQASIENFIKYNSCFLPAPPFFQSVKLDLICSPKQSTVGLIVPR